MTADTTWLLSRFYLSALWILLAIVSSYIIIWKSLVTVYFEVGSAFSIYGCCQHSNVVSHGPINVAPSDVERGTYIAPSVVGDVKSCSEKVTESPTTSKECEIANFSCFAFQLIFQVAAGAVALTDSVFWFLLYPFLTEASYRLHFMDVNLLYNKAVFLLDDTILNGMVKFGSHFSGLHFVLWTCTFVVVQWLVHACVSIWWLYPFMDLSSRFAPAWLDMLYLSVGVMHLPCYGLFALIVRLKTFVLSKSFPESTQTAN